MIGCGGGGANGGGGSNELVQFYVELPGRDALNLILGDVVLFELAGYDINNKRTKLTADSWSLSNVIGNPGTLGPNGEFVASGEGSATVKATYQGKNVIGLPLVVRPFQATLNGTVSSIYGGGISNVIVAFYNDANTEVGRARTNASGAFSASVPTTATKVNLVASLMPAGWYKEWMYRGKRYSATIPNCHAIFVVNVPLQIGVVSTMPDPIRLTPTSDPPPPPPDGCG